MKRISKASLALLLAVMMLIPMISIPSFAATYGTENFESYSDGQTLTQSGNSYLAPYQKVLVEDGNHFLRLPIVSTSAGDENAIKTNPTNRGKWYIINHSAFSTTQKTSIKADLRINGISGSNTPKAGLWLRTVNYKNTSGASAKMDYFRLFDVNLLTGALIFGDTTNKTVATTTGAAGLKTDGWNAIEVVFDPASGGFEVWINEALYATVVLPADKAGSNYTVGANQLMYCVCSGNNYLNYTAAANADETYSNCNYMDADNFVIEPAKPKPILNEGFESLTAGATLTDIFTKVIPIYKVLEENDNTFLRLPIASTEVGSENAIKTTPTNRGDYFMFKHDAFSTTEPTSVSLDLRMNGLNGSSSPNIGVWIRTFTYTNASGTAGTKGDWLHLFDLNLLTGELMTNNVNGKTTGAKGVIKGEWNKMEIIYEPKTGSFDIYINDTLYKQCTTYFEGTNFVIPANSLMLAVCSSNNYRNYTAVSALDATYSNANYLDTDNFKIVESGRGLTGKLYYSENFNNYTPGTSVALGTTPGATSTYEKDPTNANNVAVKVPFGATPNKDEILMRLTNNVPVENGWYAVTRNAQTGAVEVDGWTVTEQSNGKYTITDGATTYTDLELTTKEIYYAYWGADGTIDQNWQLPIPEISYKNQTSVILSVDYYISNDAYGNILCQMRYYSLDGGSRKGFLDLFTINTSAGTILPKGGSTYRGVNKGEWNNVMLEIDLISGTGKLYLNGVYLGDGTYGANLTLNASALSTAKINRKFNGYKSFSGYFMVDNVKLMSSTDSVTVDPTNLLYVEVDGRKVYTNTFNVPEGATYNAVYLKAEDYIGLLTTENSNSIRLATEAGLRFATKLDMTLVESLYKYLDAGDLKAVTFGTLIAPKDYYTTTFTMAMLDANSKRYLEVEADRDMYFDFDEDAGTTHFVGSIINFYASNITRDFSGRGYVRITFRSGQEIVLYSDVTQSANVKTVAGKVLEKTDFVATLTAKQKAILDTYAAGNAPAVPEAVEHIRKLDGLNVLALGDSLFNGDFIGYEEQWIARVARTHGWNLTNLGKNGWTIAYDPSISTRASIYNYLMNDANFKYGTTSSSYYNYGNSKNLTAADVDVILLEGGNNDWGSRLPIGTIDSRNEGTLMGATNLIVEKLLQTYPNATIVLVTSWHVNSNPTENGVTYSKIDYVSNFMKQLYEANYKETGRVTLVDAGDPNLTGIHMADAEWRAIYSKSASDSYHLNVEGMKIMEKAMPKLLADALFVCDAKEGISVAHNYESFQCKDCGYVDPLSVKEEDVTRVVCVGDSITAGGYWKNNMQGYLDSSYEVLGYGVSGSTGFAAGFDSTNIPKAYINQPEYALSLRTNADIVVVMLGTNDTKGYNYNRIKADGGAQYKKDMIRLIEGYKALNPDVEIFLGLPATIFRAWTTNGINDEALQELLIGLLRQIAEETGATVVDVHTATKDASAHFSDGVHPSDDTGRALIAKAFADAILAAAE